MHLHMSAKRSQEVYAKGGGFGQRRRHDLLKATVRYCAL